MMVWRCLLLVYPRVDVALPSAGKERGRFAHEMPREEMLDGIESFRCFPKLVEELTDGAAGIEYEGVVSEVALTRLTEYRQGLWWPGPDDVRDALAERGVRERFDSVFVFWPQEDFQSGRKIETGGWGLGLGASASTFGATYAAVANAQPWAWRVPRMGEVWLHEWLHGVCAHFAALGHRMPDGDADGGDRHGYVQSPETGWMEFYRDLMNGRVMEEGVATGILREAWRGSTARLVKNL